MDSATALYAVMTVTEAAKRWGVADVTVRHACTGYKNVAPRFTDREARRSGSTWLVTIDGMIRLFGSEKIQ